MRLAEHVAHTLDVDAMLDSMTPQQFDEWVAKDQVEPIGHEATRHILALIGALIAAFTGNRKVTVESFLPWVKEGKASSMTADEIKLAASMIPGAQHGIRR